MTHDYLLTNDLADHRSSVLFNRMREDDAPKINGALLVPLLHADPEYLDVTFGVIEARAGSVQRYFSELFGLDERQMAAIRSALIEPESAYR